MTANHSYRDPLAAARARIDDLEDRLADAQREAALPPEIRVRLAHLRAQRDALADVASRRAGDAVRATLGFGLLGTLIFTGVVAGMGRSGKPLNAALFGAILTAVLVTIGWLVGRSRADKDRQTVAHLDSEIRGLAGVVPEPARLAAHPAALRVEAPTAVPADADTAAEIEAVAAEEGVAKASNGPARP